MYDSTQVQAIVSAYFADIPTMIDVARCESGFRQFAADGTVLADPTNSWIGAFQISRIHADEAAALGDDINTLEGNMMYARYLYEQDGLTAWNSSKPCWGSSVAQYQAPAASALGTVPIVATSPSIAPAATATGATPGALSISIPLWLGMENESVLALQRALNEDGFTIAESGPGSPGEETEKFGAFTRAAVRKFQCEKFSLCAGDENTTGYGVVGPRTLAALEAPGKLSIRSTQ